MTTYASYFVRCDIIEIGAVVQTLGRLVSCHVSQPQNLLRARLVQYSKDKPIRHEGSAPRQDVMVQ